MYDPASCSKLTLFNHKGGVGKTTLTVNIANALADAGSRVLLVDADPQSNVSAFYLPEEKLDDALGQSVDDESDATIWSAVKPVVEAKGPAKKPQVISLYSKKIGLVLGDVLLASYEEELSGAWTEAFARKPRGYAVLCALRESVRLAAEEFKPDIIMYDVGPNVGPLNRMVVLDSDFLVTPASPDLFSLRALTTVGRALTQWMTDWQTIRELAPLAERERIPKGVPKFLGYVISAFKVKAGTEMSDIHKRWEHELGPRVNRRIVSELKSVNPALIDSYVGKIGRVKHFQSLAGDSQENGLPIARLKRRVNPGYNSQIDEAKTVFDSIAAALLSAMGRK